MITDSLYTTAQTVTVGKQDDQHDVLKTGTLNSSSGGETINDFSSYWLGYIAYTNVPMRCHPSIAYFDEDQTLHFEDVIDEANFPCGYCDDYYGSDSGGYNDVLMQRTVDGATITTTTNQIRLLNDNYPEYSGLNYNGGLFDDASGNLHFIYAKWNAGDQYQSGYTLAGVDYTFSNVAPTSDRVKKMYDVLFNDEEFSLTIENEVVKCRLSDFENGTPEFLYTSESGNYKFRLFLVYCYFPHGCGLNISTRVNVAGTYMVKTTGYGGAIEIVRSLRGLNSEAIRGNNLEGYTQSNPYKVLWGCNGVIPLATRQTIENYPTAGVPFAWDGNVLVLRRRSDTSELEYRTLLFAEDVRRVFSLHYRVDTSSGFTPSYVDGVTYATDVNKSTNEFYARLKTGNIQDDAFKNTLAPWQFSSFASNDFNEENIPPYEPEPEPGGDDTPPDEPGFDEVPHDDGEPLSLQNRSVFAPSLFTTQYALTYANLRTLGANLWNTWLTTSTDVWKNFFLPYGQDFGTLDIGACLNFITSLRVYPFEMPLDVIVQSSDGIRMGTGHTDFLGSACMRINVCCFKVDLGSLKVEPKTPYKDFRDMYNTSVSCFLPYCGTVELNPAEVMYRTLHCTYLVDLMSGGCTAVLELEGDAGKYIIASKSGQIGFMIPMTATNAGQLTAQFAKDATETLGTLSGFFFESAKTIGNTVTSAIKAISGSKEGDGLKVLSNNNTFSTNLSLGQRSVDTGLELVNQTLNRLSRSGIDIPMLSGGSGTEAMFMPSSAVVQIRRGKYSKPVNYPHSQGFLNGSSGRISDFGGKWGNYPDTNAVKGLCKFTGVDTSGLTCHEDERAEILALLESGVYV